MSDISLLPEQLQQLGLNRYAQVYPDNAPEHALVRLLALSDFAFDVLQSHPQWGAWLLDADACQQRDVPQVFESELESIDEAVAFAVLRQYRQRYWLKVAFLDLVCENNIADSIAYISKLSDMLIQSANQWAFAQVTKLNGMPCDDAGTPLSMCVLGMGKLGGFELNYSSDIDLIFAYQKNVKTQGGRRAIEAQVFYTKVAQKLIAALDQHTMDGRVFRVDMRLRPFGDSGPLVMSLAAMEDYYQEQGREWERYAMLKARLIGATDSQKDDFHGTLKPFVYRRYIDFSVIESLRNMKSLIAQEVRRKGLVDNIKLGAGGIREVEFVIQALQLIRGGREPQLQTTQLQVALAQLEELGVFDAEQHQHLREDYLLLRRVEQYLQAFNDEQTQQLPGNEQDWQRLNVLLGQQTEQQSRQLIAKTMARIHEEFLLVIGEEQEQQQSIDPSYILTWQKGDMQELCDELPDEAQRTSWQSPLSDFKERTNKRSIGKRGRDKLDALMPELLHALVQMRASAQVLSLVTNVIDKVVSRTAYLELLVENLDALKQLVRLCAHSRWIGEHIARYPILLDELIDPAQLYKPLPLSAYRQEIRQYFLRIDDTDLEMQMEALRQFKQTHQLRIAAADATGALPLMKVSDHLSALAEAIIEYAVNLGWQQMVNRYGCPEGFSMEHKGFAVIAYGKAGGIELGYNSDLDLVFVHNDNGEGHTDGDKQISSRQFYVKLAQRLMHLFSTRTTSGTLYELDTRLRPEGSSGLLAINIESFLHYQQTQAWTWEHQALVRARMVYGCDELKKRFEAIRKQIICTPRELDTLREDVVKMREKMRKHLSKDNEVMVDLKQGIGAMVDIEFITQYLALAHSHQHPELIEFSDNIRILSQASQCGCISEQESQNLIDAYCHYRGLYHVLSLRNQDKVVAKFEVQAHLDQVTQVWQRLLG